MNVLVHVLKKFVCLFLAVLGLCCYVQASSGCSEQGLPLVAVCGLLITGGTRASVVAAHGTRVVAE